MKRVFGRVEAFFDIAYLTAGTVMGMMLLLSKNQMASMISVEIRHLAGVMALVLVFGDAFHLLPRLRVILGGDEERLRAALGRGKQITSITMTVFYLLLWQITLAVLPLKSPEQWTAAMYILAAVRIVLCLAPQNKWLDRHPPLCWGIFRNVPFFMMGLVVVMCFFILKSKVGALQFMWAAVFLSFMFYLPVVLWSNKYPKTGMLMLPKTCCYLWMLSMCLAL